MKYGATRTELSIISDPNLGFKQTILELLKQQQTTKNLSIDENKITQNYLKNVSKSTEKSENIDEKLETSHEDTEIEIDSTLQLLSENVEGTIYDQILNICLNEAIDEMTEQTNSNKKEIEINSSDQNIDTPFDISILSKIGWPKERILFSRLELIVQTIEKGEWPFSKNQGTSTSQDREALVDSVKGGKDEVIPLFHSSEIIKSEPQLPTFKSKRRGRKRTVTQFIPSNSLNDVQKNDLIKIEDNILPEESNIRAAYDSWSAALSFSLSSDPAMLIQKMLQMTPEINSSLPSSSVSMNDSTNTNRISNSNNGLDLSHLFKMKSTTNGSSTDSSVWSMSQSSTLKSNKNNVRRGRRPKHTGPYEMSRDSKRDSTSRLNMFNNRLMNTGSSGDNFNSNPETIIPVINIFNGTLIYDETAPKRKNLENFLIHNANYMPYSVEEEDQKIFNKVAKSRGQETGPLESMIFTQYMNFMMSTMLASQSPINIYNSSLLTGEGSKNSLPEEQINPTSFYMQQYQESILSMLGAANQSISGLDLKSVVNEDINKNKKRSSSPIRNTGIPVKIKSYSISHLTDDDNIETPDENKTPAHSNLTTTVGTGEKVDDKQKCISSTVPRNSTNPTKVSTNESSNKLHMSNQNSDILASYQAYLYSAMLYSDYISSMQQYSLLNNNKITNALPDIFNNFKHPQQSKTNEFFQANNSQSNLTSTPNIPIELTLSSSNSKMNKRTKVTSFSVESMGISAVVSSPSMMSSVEQNGTSHISLQDVSDDYAVLDLSNR